MNMRVCEPYCVATEHNEHMHFTSLRHLRQCWCIVLSWTNEYEGVKPCCVAAEHNP